MHSETEERHRMVKEQIEARGIKDPQLLEVLRKIPRHLFLFSALFLQHPLTI